MEKLIRSLYIIRYSKKQTTRDQMEQVKLIRDIVCSTTGFEFLEQHARPGNRLYGEYMKERNRRLMEKLS